MRVALAGEALIDFAGIGEMRFQGYCGGSPLNTAVAAARLGQATGYITQLSTDLFGVRLRRHLEENGVDTRFVLSHCAPTTLAFVEHDGEQSRYQFLARGSADSLYAPDPLPELPAETAFLHFGSVSLLLEPAASSITRLVERHRSRVVIVFDPNVRPTLIENADAYRRRCAEWIRACHLLKLSEEDAAYLAGHGDLDSAVAAWLESGPRAALVTHGARGLRLYRRAAAPLRVPAFRVPVADTIGAGDTLTAATIVALIERGAARAEDLNALSEPDWREVLTFAAAAAALNCMRPGADPPTRREVGEFLSASCNSAGR
ncbi:MAG TPA: carbohydrate kinase [Burkholderiales bacterium]|nr:carbohydrate kinase [Burkholderiales bacterium]